MIGLVSNQQRLVSHRRPQTDDFRSLVAFVGPTDLTFFSSPVDGHLLLFEGDMAQDGVNFFGVVRVMFRNHGVGLDELHVDAFRHEEALVFGYVPWQAEHCPVGLARDFFQIRPLILIIFMGSFANLTTVCNRGRTATQAR